MNFVAQKFARVGDRQQQHRQLQPYLTRPERRRSGDGVRGRWGYELLPGDRGNRRHPALGVERARDAPDLLPPPAEGHPQRRAALRGRPAAHQLRAVGRRVARPRRRLRHRAGQCRWRGRSSPPGSRTGSSSSTPRRASRRYSEAVEPYTLEYAERETGVPADTIREMAHAYARADRAMICWTLGITEHHNAVDNVLALINLALLTGHVGRYGSGLNPLRGQNNVQGGGDMGALPDRSPASSTSRIDEFRAKFERRWGVDDPAEAAAGTCRRCSRRWSAASSRRSTSSARTRSSRRPTRHQRGIGSRASTSWSCRTSSSPRPPRWPTSSSRPRPAGASREGTVTNSERRVQRVRKALEPPGEARDDVGILVRPRAADGPRLGRADAPRTSGTSCARSRPITRA